MSRSNFDVLVIGSGVNGGFSAYHAARNGLKVCVLERAEPGVEPSASWASAGGVRRLGRHVAEVPLAIEAIERWKTLEDELEADLKYHRDGMIIFAETDEDAVAMEAFVREQNENGLDDVRLIDRAEALEIVPGINDRVINGSYSPSDGHAHPPSTTRAVAAAAQRHGAEYRNGVRVTELIQQGDRVVGVRTAEGDEYFADETVLAAGAWSDEIAGSIGLRLPIYMRVPQMLLTTPGVPGTLKPVLSSRNRALSLKQLPGGEFFIGGGWPGEVGEDRLSYTVLPSSVEGSWAAATGLLPAVAETRIAQSWCGLEAQSIDGLPFIGRVPGVDGLVLAVGSSGHGFAISPAVGRAVAEVVMGRPTPQLDGLSPARIFSFDPEAVDKFINERPIHKILSIG